ncbi:DUF6588 family protein [Lutibacter sp.]|uniref:DUF6588 family protein n=1 Tax=Lutibacter sp. TaxID=1925666 RepID=UPI002734E0A6|nr:DUF6588 family protein [Lutibacter sp.]MDP3313010.1 hypothetical protein [Lutibacter sp.]
MKKIVLMLIVLAFNFNLKAQDGLEAILLAGVQDANKLTEAYMNPAMKGLIYGMNSGWYHTAKAHKKFGFDISIGLNASIVPSKDEFFKFADLGLSSSTTSTSVIGATVAGSNSLEAPIEIKAVVEGQQVTANFTMPAGVKEDLPLNAVPTPSVQFSLGLPKQFDVMIRLVPEVGSNDVKGNLLGLGLKKEITNWFGVFEKTPLHISLLGAYTSMDVNYNIQNDSSISGSNQEATFNLSSYTVQAIASLNFPIINFYGGIGYAAGTSEFKMKGTYDLEYNTGLPSPNDKKVKTVTDPVNLDFEASGIRATVGARLSLGFFKIFADYTVQEYNTISGGFAFSFR